jgi:RimJ/RimL family protein N-acetyltransferase
MHGAMAAKFGQKGLRHHAMTTQPLVLRLRQFDPLYASILAGWVTTAEELRLLAPATDSPLTAAKVRSWHKKDVHPFLGWLDGEDQPVGYGEINSMPYADGQMWLGHILVAPSHRHLGLGQRLVRGLLEIAFDEFNAWNVCLIVFPDNSAAIRCYEAVGMTEVSPERWRHPETGEVCILLRMEIGRRKYRALSRGQSQASE